MRVCGLLNSGDFEKHKRVMQRKEAKDAYKKYAIFTQVKNPMLKVLEDLLTGKTEKELYVNEHSLLNKEKENINAALTGMNENVESSLEAADTLRQPSETKQQSEVAIDEEKNISRDSFVRFNHLVAFELLTDTTAPADSTNSFKKSFESLIFEKTYTKAISSYTNHMLMAKNGFEIEQNQFSYIA